MSCRLMNSPAPPIIPISVAAWLCRCSNVKTKLDLARAWREKGDERALHTLVQAYARLAVSVASKFRHYGLPISDLIQEGNIGLMQAAARFDPSRDVRFSTYAMWWIRASVQDFVLRNWSIVRTGHHVGA